MSSVWAWIGRHGRALKLGSVAAAFVLVVGGVTLGMNSASGSPAPPLPGPAASPPAVVQPSSHYVVGTVADVVMPGRAIVRTKNGRFVVVDYDKETVIRRDRQSQTVSALRRGTRVIILGEPRNGRLHADVVTITGTAPARQLPAAVPMVATPSPVPPKPAASPARTSTPKPAPSPTPRPAAPKPTSAPLVIAPLAPTPAQSSPVVILLSQAPAPRQIAPAAIALTPAAKPDASSTPAVLHAAAASAATPSLHPPHHPEAVQTSAHSTPTRRPVRAPTATPEAPTFVPNPPRSH